MTAPKAQHSSPSAPSVQPGSTATQVTDLDRLVQRLRVSRDETHNVRHRHWTRPPPSREAIAATVNMFAAALFPAHYGQPELTSETIDDFVRSTLDIALTSLTEQLGRSLPFTAAEQDSEEYFGTEAHRIAHDFAETLPSIRGLLVSDLHAAHRGDPAAHDTLEIMLVYPGMTAMIHYRLAHVGGGEDPALFGGEAGVA